MLAAATALRTLPTLARHPRALGSTFAGAIASARSRPMVEQMLAAGFIELRRQPDRAWVGGCVGRLWALTDTAPLEVAGATEFEAFDRPGYAKATLDFTIEPAPGGSLLSSETRVVTTSADARLEFERYWRLTLPAGGAIRRDWLAAIRRRAERSA